MLVLPRCCSPPNIDTQHVRSKIHPMYLVKSSSSASIPPFIDMFWSLTSRDIQIQSHLVGGFNPSEKYAHQIGFHFPKDRVKIPKQHLKPPPSHSEAPHCSFNNCLRSSGGGFRSGTTSARSGDAAFFATRAKAGVDASCAGGEMPPSRWLTANPNNALISGKSLKKKNT